MATTPKRSLDDGCALELVLGSSDVIIFGAERCLRFLLGILCLPSSIASSSSSRIVCSAPSLNDPLKLELRILFPAFELIDRLGRMMISTSSEATPGADNGGTSSLSFPLLARLKVKNLEKINSLIHKLTKRFFFCSQTF